MKKPALNSLMLWSSIGGIIDPLVSPVKKKIAYPLMTKRCRDPGARPTTSDHIYPSTRAVSLDVRTPRALHPTGRTATAGGTSNSRR